MTSPSRPSFEGDLDEATRRAIFDLRRLIAELQELIDDLDSRVTALEGP